MIPGARVDTREGHALLLYPIDRAAWSRLTRLLSIGKARGGKGCCLLDLADVAAHAEDMVGILLPDMVDAITAAQLDDVREVFGLHGYAALSFRRRPDDIARLHALDAMIREAGLRAVATGDILYHTPERRPLQDVVSAIREKCPVEELGFRRERFMDRNLKSPREMERRFAAFPDAIQASADVAGICRFDLGEIQTNTPMSR
jgi:error-prone DNA polymerase